MGTGGYVGEAVALFELLELRLCELSGIVTN